MAKSVEDDARKTRVEWEEKIIAGIGLQNDESSKTHDMGNYKVTIKPAVTRKLDIEGAKDVIATLPEERRPVKLVADETGLKWLMNNEPKLYKKLVPWVETKVGKTGVTVVRKG